MREPKYLSPSSVSKFFSNREDYYNRYLCPHKNPREPQAIFMAVGSAFDAYVKSEIHTDIFGKTATMGTEFEFGTIFEAQVEARIRDECMPIATDVWEQYVDSGAYASLRDDIAASDFAPEMEFSVEKEVGGVPLLGKPDLRYISKENVHIICDFKVNGSASKTGASPFQGYKIARDAYGSTTHGKPHKKYSPMDHKGLEINSMYLEVTCDYWADQLATYSWLLNEEVGSEDYVVRMEQLCMRPVKSRDLPRGKFVTHMNRISSKYQHEMLAKYQQAWALIKSGHIFTNLTLEKSQAYCNLLDRCAQTPKSLFPALHRSSEAPRFFSRKG